jgi:ABC-type nitrate/sulfonate/bicarbonate transport system substrate-binding protein
VLVANNTRLRNDPSYRSEVKRFVGAFLTGTADARRHPARALAIMKKVTASDPKFLARAVPATLRLLAGPKGVGCLSVAAWQRFGDWMHTTNLLKKPVTAASVATASFLPSRCR